MKAACLKMLFLIAFLMSWKAGPEARAQGEPAARVIEKMELMLDTVAVYEYNRTRQWQQGFQDLMKQIYHDPGLRLETEHMMTEFLRSDATKAGKQFICKEIGIIGSEASVPILSEMLADPEMSGTALLALEKIPGDAADRALRDALHHTDKKTTPAVVNAIAVRGDIQAVEQLGEICYGQDRKLAGVAIAALGTIGSPSCAGILEGLFSEADETLKWKVADSWLKCAEHFLMGHEIDPAMHIYNTVFDADPPQPLRNAALRGKFLNSGEDPSVFITRHLKSEDPGFHRQVIELINLIHEPENLGRIFSDIPDLPEASREYLIVTLACAGDFSVRPAIHGALDQGEQSFRIAALKAIPGVGMPSDALLLASMAAGKQGAEREAARHSLDILTAGGTNDSIIAAIGYTEGRIKAELIRSAGERNMKEAISILLVSVNSQDLNVSLESVRALGKLAPPEYLPEISKILLHTESRRVRLEAERAVLSLIQKLPPGADRSGDVISVLSNTGEPASLVSLVAILGQIGDRKDLPVLREYLESENDEIQLAAIKALSGWPDAGPAPDLLAVVRSTDDLRKHTLSLRGYVEVTVSDNRMDAGEKLNGIQTAWDLVSGQGEKKTVISGLGRVHSLEALDMALELMKDPEIKNEAETAAIIIADETSWGSPEETRDRLLILLSSTGNEDHTTRAKRILERIQ